MRIKITFAIALILSLSALANGPVVVAASTDKNWRTTAPYKAITALPYNASQAKKHSVAKKPSVPCPAPPLYSAMLYQGSLKYNIIRIGHNYGWKTVVWEAPEDYVWIGTARITGTSLSAIMNKILRGYPLQAQFYQGNRVLAIVPRNLP